MVLPKTMQPNNNPAPAVNDNTIDSILNGLADAQGKYEYLTGEGVHTVEIQAVKGVVNQDQKFRIAVEFKIVDSNTLAPGLNFNWLFRFQQKYPSWDEREKANYRDFLIACVQSMGASLEASQIDQLGKLAISEDQPLAGAVVKCISWEKQSKEGKSFTQVKFEAKV